MNSDFEKRLQQQIPRDLPREWRSDILQQAKAAAVVQASLRQPRSLLTVFGDQLTALLWPNPKAWAGLAVLWIMIFALNLSVGDSEIIATFTSAPASTPTVLMARPEQQQFLAELEGDPRRDPADRRKTFVPRPRSEVQWRTINV